MKGEITRNITHNIMSKCVEHQHMLKGCVTHDITHDYVKMNIRHDEDEQ